MELHAPAHRLLCYVKTQKYNNVQKSSPMHSHGLLTSEVSAATIPREMPGKATSIAIDHTEGIGALAPELAGT